MCISSRFFARQVDLHLYHSIIKGTGSLLMELDEPRSPASPGGPCGPTGHLFESFSAPPLSLAPASSRPHSSISPYSLLSEIVD